MIHTIFFNSSEQSEEIEQKKVRASSIKADLGQNFVQKRDGPRTVKLKVGGRATLYEGTKVKIRCPVKRFDR